MRNPSVLLFLAAVATPLSAQIRVPRPKLPNPVAAHTTPPTPAPKFDDRVLEITDARLTAFMRGLAAEQGSVARFKEAERRQADLQAAAEVRRRQDTRTDAQRQAAADAEGRKATQCWENTPIYKDARGPDREQRMQNAAMKATQSGSAAAMQAFTDSIQRAVLAQDSLLQAAAIRCGLDKYGDPLPPESERPVEQVYVRDSLLKAGTAASGMEQGPYQIMRERVTAFLGSDPGDAAHASMGFSAVEIRALEAKRRDLARYQELLTEY